jgi:hypothetical protein
VDRGTGTWPASSMTLSGVRPVSGQPSGIRTLGVANPRKPRVRAWAENLLSWTACHVIGLPAPGGARSRAGRSNNGGRGSTLGRGEGNARAMSLRCTRGECSRLPSIARSCSHVRGIRDVGTVDAAGTSEGT